jgi:hypothetical protein
LKVNNNKEKRCYNKKMIYTPTTTTTTTEEDDDTDESIPTLIIHDNASEIARTKIFPANFIEPSCHFDKDQGIQRN